METIVMNIYWNDLSHEGKESLVSAGFAPSRAQLLESEAIGAIATNIPDEEVERYIQNS